jgi:hypothetical protein
MLQGNRELSRERLPSSARLRVVFVKATRHSFGSTRDGYEGPTTLRGSHVEKSPKAVVFFKDVSRMTRQWMREKRHLDISIG